MKFETPTEDRTEYADGQHQTKTAGTAQTRIIAGLRDVFEPIDELEFEDGRQLKRKPKGVTSKLKPGTAGPMMQTKMANPDKTIGQYMGKETADELQWWKRHDLFFALVTVIEIFERDGIPVDRENAMIGNGDAEDVTAKILHELLDTVGSGLNKNLPISSQGLLNHGCDIQSAIKGVEAAIFGELGKGGAELVAELIGKQLYREKKFSGSRLPAIARWGGNECAAGDNEVKVEMILHGLPPGMQDHGKADVTAQIFASENF